MISFNGLDITINKENAAGLNFEFEGDDSPEDGVETLFVVKRTPGFSTPSIIEKAPMVMDSTVKIDLTKDDVDIAPGTYFWNIMILFDNGEEPWTLIQHWPTFKVVP